MLAHGSVSQQASDAFHQAKRLYELRLCELRLVPMSFLFAAPRSVSLIYNDMDPIVPHEPRFESGGCCNARSCDARSAYSDSDDDEFASSVTSSLQGDPLPCHDDDMDGLVPLPCHDDDMDGLDGLAEGSGADACELPLPVGVMPPSQKILCADAGALADDGDERVRAVLTLDSMDTFLPVLFQVRTPPRMYRRATHAPAHTPLVAAYALWAGLPARPCSPSLLT